MRGRWRLALEVIVIVVAAAGIWWSGSRAAAETLLTAWGVSYLVMADRSWLLTN